MQASAPSAAQLTRFRKILHEPFFMLSLDAPGRTPGAAARFTVAGSQTQPYDVELLQDGRTTCTCADARMNCTRLRCVCKHVCFLLFRVLRLESPGGFFRRGLKLTAEELEAVLARRSAADGVDHRLELSNQGRSLDEMTARLGRLRIGNGLHHPPRSFAHVARPPEPDDECPVCYDMLLARLGGGDALCGCPDCGRAVHVRCALRWMQQQRTCVYCRSPAWADWNGCEK